MGVSKNGLIEPWVLVAGGFHRNGGMDRCNLALAQYLISRSKPVHVVCHSLEPDLRKEAVAVHLVPKPANSFLLGEFLLEKGGRQVAQFVKARSPDARVVVNGGNCPWPDINWVHYVHAAWRPAKRGLSWTDSKTRLTHGISLRREKAAFRKASILIANSERTRRDLIETLQIDPASVHTVWLGSDPQFSLPSAEKRAGARARFSFEPGKPLVVFVGAFGDDARKGFDVLFSAWLKLCRRPDWDAHLLVAGGGRAVEFWKERVKSAGIQERIGILGHTGAVADLLAAADLLVSPARYESYGLNVHEALCCGVPAMVTRTAGVAERYPAELQPLLIDDPEDAEALAAKLLRWRIAMQYWREKVLPFSQALRAYTLDDMAHRMVMLCTGDLDRGVRPAFC